MLPRPRHQPTAARVLVVEDEVLIRLALADELRTAGLLVVEAATADEALSYLDAGDPIDLVFSDVNMPGSLDGLGLARRMREDYPSLPIILTSGTPRSHDADGIGLFIPKPYNVEQAAKTILDVLALDPQGNEE